MTKRRITNVGVGLLGILILPGLAQAQEWKSAQEGAIKIYKEFNGTLKYTEKVGTAIPNQIGAHLKTSQALNKAISQASRSAKVGTEVSKVNIPNKTIAEGAKEIQAPGNALKSLDQVKNTASPVRKPTQDIATTQKMTDLNAPKKYYSLNNKTDNFPTLVQNVEGQATQNIVQPVGDVETKNFSYTPGSSIGSHYQKEQQYDVWLRFGAEVHELGKKGTFSWNSFPETLAEQEEYIAKFLENQKDDVKELFDNSHLDITTQAQIAYTAHEWRKLTLKDIFSHVNHPKVGIIDVLFSSNKEVNIRMLFYQAEMAMLDWTPALQRTYGVDRTLQETIDWASRNHHLTLVQVEELLKSIDLRREAIEQMNELELPHIINQKARGIAQATQAQWEIASRAVSKSEVPLPQRGELEDVIMMGRLNPEQSEQVVEKALDAAKRWDSSGSGIHRLWLLLRKNQAKGITFSAQQVLEEADRVFNY